MESLASPRRGSISSTLASNWVPSGNSLRRSEPRGVPVWPAGMEARALALVARADAVLVLHRLPRVSDDGLAAQPELALLVDADDLDLDLGVLLEDVVEPRAAIVARLGHVHEALHAARVGQRD